MGGHGERELLREFQSRQVAFSRQSVVVELTAGRAGQEDLAQDDPVARPEVTLTHLRNIRHDVPLVNNRVVVRNAGVENESRRRQPRVAASASTPDSARQPFSARL